LIAAAASAVETPGAIKKCIGSFEACFEYVGPS
jgi:hypothetical protein